MSSPWEHRWSGWPGAFCLDCFCEDPIEIAMAENNFTWEEDGSDNGAYFFPNVQHQPCPFIWEPC